MDKAFQQVGRVLYHFSLLEQEINSGIGKILGIEGGALSVVVANVDFARKVSIIRASEELVAEMPDGDRKKFVRDTWSAVMAQR
ncbi:MAG: hypothetical protein ACRYG4_07485 [Janthinobacterium lividum]